MVYYENFNSACPAKGLISFSVKLFSFFRADTARFSCTKELKLQDESNLYHGCALRPFFSPFFVPVMKEKKRSFQLILQLKFFESWKWFRKMECFNMFKTYRKRLILFIEALIRCPAEINYPLYRRRPFLVIFVPLARRKPFFDRLETHFRSFFVQIVCINIGETNFKSKGFVDSSCSFIRTRYLSI